jgi:hypothetical protein
MSVKWKLPGDDAVSRLRKVLFPSGVLEELGNPTEITAVAKPTGNSRLETLG